MMKKYRIVLLMSLFSCCLSDMLLASNGMEKVQPKEKTLISFDLIKRQFPKITNWFVKIKNQPLVVSSDNIARSGESFGTQWSYLSKNHTVNKTSEGVRFGTFVHDETMVYLRAGLQNKSFKAPSSVLMSNDVFNQHSLKSITPGLGLQWGGGHVSVSGEIRASVPYSGQHSSLFYRNVDKKTSGELLIQARYKIGNDKKSSYSSLSKKNALNKMNDVKIKR